MKRALVFITTLSLSLLATPVHAAGTIVNVSASATGGSDAEASVHNVVNVKGTSTSTSTTTSKTSVHIESNGEVQDYNSDSGSGVDMQTKDGNVSVHIASNSTTTATPSPASNAATTNLDQENKTIQEKIDAANKKAAEDRAKLLDKNKSLFQRIQEALQNFWNKFFKHF